MNDTALPLVEMRNIVKSYDNGQVVAVRAVSLVLEQGKIYALHGRSGCGKSTLLNLIGTLDLPDSGQILYLGEQYVDLNALSRLRRDLLGFVFQFHHLLPILSLRENVETALVFKDEMTSKQKKEVAEQSLIDVGLASKMDVLARDVSGGERQRAAIARALVGNPLLILADEPTGNVDTQTSIEIMNRLRQRVSSLNATALIATHDTEVLRFADIILHMQDGIIQEESSL